MKLQRSQIEVLEAVERYQDDQLSDRGPGASPAQIARHVDRYRPGIEAALARLEDRGLVKSIYHPLISATYCLTEVGRQALSEEGKRG